MQKITTTYHQSLTFRLAGFQRLLACLALFTALLTLGVGTSHGKVGFGAMPLEASLQAPRPGARITSEISVFNTGDVPLFINAGLGDYGIDASGQLQFFEPDTQPLSCAKWLQFNPKEFIVQPKQAVRVRYSIATPADMDAEHSTMVILTSRPVPVKGQPAFAFPYTYRIASLVRIAPAQKIEKSATVTRITATPTGQTTIALNNTSAVHTRIKGTVEALDEQGQVVSTALFKSSLALPRTTRYLQVNWDKPLLIGKYKIRAVLDYGGKQLTGGEAAIDVTEVAPVEAPATPPTTQKPAEEGRAENVTTPAAGDAVAPTNGTSTNSQEVAPVSDPAVPGVNNTAMPAGKDEISASMDGAGDAR
ncbi:MAG TPA: hypothetical protein VGA96_03895 [Fibrella sp.]